MNRYKEIIEKSKWDIWEETKEELYTTYKNKDEVNSFLNEVLDVIDLLNKKDIDKGLESLKNKYGNLKQRYVMNIAQMILKFYQKGPLFLDKLINTFDYVSREEDAVYTNEIQDTKRINSLIKEGLPSLDAQNLVNNKCALIPLSFMDITSKVIRKDDLIYWGLTDDDKLIIYSEINTYVSVAYVFDNEKDYRRYLSNNYDKSSYTEKIVVTDKDNNILDISKTSLEFNNTLIVNDDLSSVYKKIDSYYKAIDLETIFTIIREIINFHRPINKDSNITNAEAIINNINFPNKKSY